METHNRFFTYQKYFGELGTDGKGTTVFGFENYSEKRQPTFHFNDVGGCMGYVGAGSVQIEELSDSRQKVVRHVIAGQWFTTRGECTFRFSDGPYRIFVCQTAFTVGMITAGLVEQTGRLNYIDGCRDTVLFSPIKKGMPCINALYMPSGVHQTMHTHPSLRAGYIIQGGAVCQTNESTHQLETGMIFFLPENGWHKFRSDLGEDITMKLVAYHPDSDFGPSDQEHPMLNRTMVGDVSAKDMPEIQTKG